MNYYFIIIIIAYLLCFGGQVFAQEEEFNNEYYNKEYFKELEKILPLRNFICKINHSDYFSKADLIEFKDCLNCVCGKGDGSGSKLMIATINKNRFAHIFDMDKIEDDAKSKCDNLYAARFYCNENMFMYIICENNGNFNITAYGGRRDIPSEK